MRAGKFDLLVGSLLLAVSSVAGSVAFAFHDVPLETDAALTLAGANWVANDSISTSVFVYSVHFTDGDGYEYDSIKMSRIGTTGHNYVLGYSATGSSDYNVAWRNSVWSEDYYKELYFTGGDDIGNADLISWLRSNGSLSYSYDNAASAVDSAENSAYVSGLYDAYLDVDQGIYVQWSTSSSSNRVFNVTWDSSATSGSHSLSYSYPTVYFERPAGTSISFAITANNGVPFRVMYSSSSSDGYQVISSDLFVDDVLYLPTWEGSITLMVMPDDTTGSSSSYDFTCDLTASGNVRLNNDYVFGYRDGNSAGYESGYADGYSSGQNVGASVGYSNGYSYGYDVGFDAGYAANAEDGAPVIDIWKLLSTVVTMPFTFVSQGLDWTLFAGTKYEFSVSVFFGSLLVLLMLWKVLQLVIGFFK